MVGNCERRSERLYLWHSTRCSPSFEIQPVDASIARIGPDFGEELRKWSKGAMTGSGIIYCPPLTTIFNGILKIDTNTDTVTELDANLLPERNYCWYCYWQSCALPLDGCIYFMPCGVSHIMKLDPNNNDAISSVRVDLVGDEHRKYIGTVVGIDGCLHGIPDHPPHRIVKYDPINDITSFIGEADTWIDCNAHCILGDGALGRDGCIYVGRQVLKICTANNSYATTNGWQCFM